MHQRPQLRSHPSDGNADQKIGQKKSALTAGDIPNLEQKAIRANNPMPVPKRATFGLIGSLASSELRDAESDEDFEDFEDFS